MNGMYCRLFFDKKTTPARLIRREIAEKPVARKLAIAAGALMTHAD